MRRLLFLVFLTALSLCAVLLPRQSRSDTAPIAPTPLAPAKAQAETGGGTDTGVYLPPLAGPSGEVVGTVLADQGTSAASAFYIGVVDDAGKTKYYRGTTDERGRFRLNLAKIAAAGTAALMLFKHFDKDGKPDEGSFTKISKVAAHLPEMEAVAGVPAVGPALVEVSTAYQRGGTTQGIVAMQTRGIDPLASRVTIDGNAAATETLAAADRSIVAKLHDDVALGAHRFAVQSGSKTTNEQPAFVVALRFDPLPPLRTGQTATVRLHVDGLGKTPASAVFTVSGGVKIADGSPSKTVPIRKGQADITVRAEHAGTFRIATAVSVLMADVVAALPRGGKAPPGQQQANAPEEKPPQNNAATPDVQCKYHQTAGWFEPAQGAWQDDKSFPDMAGKQITRLHDMDPVPHYNAELHMVADRDTLLFGIEHYEDKGAKVGAGTHDTIVIKYKTDCTDNDYVEFKFTVTSGSKTFTFTEPKTYLQIPLHGKPSPNGKEREISVELPARDGVPSPADDPFKMSAGPYTIEAEIVKEDGAKTGLKVVVNGQTDQTTMPLIHFVPVQVVYKRHGKTETNYNAEKLDGYAQSVATSSAENLPDYYPLASGVGAAKTIKEKLLVIPYDSIRNNWLSDLARGSAGAALGALSGSGASLGAEFLQKSPIKERLKNELAASEGLRAYLNGTDRVALVFGKLDFGKVELSPIASENLGDKTMIFSNENNHYDVGHETAHTIPPQNWDPNGECGVVYHDTGSSGRIPDPRGSTTQQYKGIAGGERVRHGDQLDSRERDDDLLGIMQGSASSASASAGKEFGEWIEQCTFWHLVKQLPNPPDPPDPPVTFVRGIFWKTSSGPQALIAPAYQMGAPSDFDARSTGRWAWVVRDAARTELARYRFDPILLDEHERPVNARPFAYHFPSDSRAATIELASPRGVQTMLRLSPRAPSLAVDPLSFRTLKGRRIVTVHWKASAATSYPAYATVFYSPDDGKSNYTELLEARAVDNVTFTLPPRTSRNQVRVIVTDWTRSTERIIRF